MEPQSESQQLPSRRIALACMQFARHVKVADGSLSQDVFGERVGELHRAAEDALREHVARAGTADEDLLVGAVAYLAEVHDGPWRGTAWFRHGLDVLLSVASVSGGMSDSATGFLEHLQQSVNATVSERIRSREDFPMTAQEAATSKQLEAAAHSYPAVAELLSVAERFHYGAPEDGDSRRIRVAALTAALARVSS